MMERREERRDARGDSGGDSFTPLSLDPYIWIEADEGVTQVANRISSHVSKVGGFSFTAVGAAQLLYAASNASFNNKPTFAVDGAARYMQATGLSIPFPFSTFKYSSYTAAGTVYGGNVLNGTQVGMGWETTAAQVSNMVCNDGSFSFVPTIADAGGVKRSLYQGCSAAKAATLIRNGSVVATGTATNAPVASTMIAANVGHPSLGRLEVFAVYMIFRKLLTTPQVLQLHNWCVEKYG